VATGQGLGNVSFPNEAITEIRCCARGINGVFPLARTVIDVQAQSSQVIQLNESGQVTGFAVSEKCAAGSGRFMEVIANVLQVELKDIGPLSLKSKNPVAFSTGCAVFGGTEAVSKISALVERVGMEADCALSGGGGLDSGLIRAVEEKLDVKLLIPPQPQIITALGAAIMAEEMVDSGE
jgi:activator of 2-hydroxyglutaryl-CoA dehydratase